MGDDDLKKYFDSRFNELKKYMDRRFDEMDRRFGEMEINFIGLRREIEEINYKMDRLEHRFSRHEKMHEIEKMEGGIYEEDFLLKPSVALGGIQGEISETGEFMKWIP